MKKVLRIGFCVIVFCVLFSAIYNLLIYYDLYKRNVNRNPNFIPPLVVGFLSFFSLIFNISKIIVKKYLGNILNTIFRIGDLIFASSILVLVFVNFYAIIVSFLKQEVDKNYYYTVRIVTYLLIFCFSIILLHDNFMYHKELKNKKAI